MSPFQIYISNRMEILVRRLADEVRKPPASPLTPEMIIVQSRGMERWVSMALSRHNGVCANACFPFPNAFLETVFKKAIPELPDISPYDPEVMAFRLMHLIPRLIEQAGFDQLKTYLADDDTDLKLFQLSRKLADLFDQYLVFRPQLIFQWEQQEEKNRLPPQWQAQLWRELVRESGNRHRARLRESLLEQIGRGELETAGLPQRIAIFGISYLPPFHLEAFAALSRLIEINLFLIGPCREYWADIVSEPEIQHMRRKTPGIADHPEWYHFERGNRLLASMGTLGRDFFDRISALDCEIHEQFEDPGESSLLTGIQTDILNLRDRQPLPGNARRQPSSKISPEMAVFAPPIPASADDTSIQIHSCHSPMREIEVLHDHLLAMFEENPSLTPQDIIVMTPDIETYAPYVLAVFGAQTDEALRIPFSIADRSSRSESRILDGFLALLDLKDSRFGARQVLGFLEFPGIKEKFGMVESHLKLIEHWVRETHIRWGIDEGSRLRAGLPGYTQNTWRAGLERLLLGYALPGENRFIFAGILPYDPIEGREAHILGNFLEFLRCLFGWEKTLAESRPLSEWQAVLTAALDQFFKTDEKSERDLQFLRQHLERLSSMETLAGYGENIGSEVIRCYFKSVLEQSGYGTGFLTGGVTFCALLPMRSIPFEVICLIGMNDGIFPREDQPLNFDLMAKYPEAGDRSRRKDDKYLFLESLISARRKLYISYIGQSIQDNSRIPPSVLVSELLDTIAVSFELPGRTIRDHLETTHRLQPFSREYFRRGSGLFSYSRENMRACTAADEKKEPPPFIRGKLPIGPAEVPKWRNLDPNTLGLFYSHPTKFFLRQRLGILLTATEGAAEERENFELKPLERFLFEQHLLDSSLSGLAPEVCEPIHKALGQLPHGHVGDYHYREMSIAVEKFVTKIGGLADTAGRNPIQIDFKIADVHLRGPLPTAAKDGCIRIRYARRRAKDLLTSWIYHLLYCHTASADSHPCSLLVCRDSALRFDPVPAAGPILRGLLELFQQGLEQPIHFFPETSFEYAEHLLRRSASEASALKKAERKWVGSEFVKAAPGESQDAYHDLCFRGTEPLDDPFKEIALAVFTPLLAASKEILL